MKYFVKIDGTEREVDVRLQEPSVYLCQIDGQPSFVVHATARHGRLHLVDDRQSRDVSVSLRSRDLSSGGHRHRVQVESQRLRSLKESSGSTAEDAKDGVVASPMPGRVVKNLVKEGDAVSRGQGVVVVEAMKMENELKAPAEGIIKRLFAQDGDLVDAGAPLVEIDVSE